MTNPNHEIILTDHKGLRITDKQGSSPLKGALSLKATRAVGRIGRIDMQMPKSFDKSILSPDKMIQVWRAPAGGKMGLWRVFFLRGWRFSHRGDKESIVLYGPDTNDLLRRRIVAAFAGSGEASQTDFADDMMKGIVRGSLSDLIAPIPDTGTRAWPDFSVQADLSHGPSISKDFSFDRLMKKSGQGIIPAISKASKIAGNQVWFDIVPDVVSGKSISFQFQTATGQPGRDQSSRVTFSLDDGNLKDPYYEEDYTNEVNYVYGTGQGEGPKRVIQQVSDSDRIGVSQWNRCEDEADARNQQSPDAVREAARSKLEDGKPQISAGGIPLDTKGTPFGTAWDVGDLVTEKYEDIQFKAIVWAVTLSLAKGRGESITTRLEFESGS